MLSLPSVAGEVVAFVALAAGTYYFVLREAPKQAQPQNEPDAVPAVEQRGVIGLSVGSSAAPSAASPSSSAAAQVVAVPQIDTVGVDINDYLDSADAAGQPRTEEELAWATSSLFDLRGCGGVVVVDSAGDVIWATGDLVADTTELGSIPSQVAKSGLPQVKNVEQQTEFPFLAPETRCVATLPVGKTGAVMVIASAEEDFFDVYENRVASAVCSRLASFL